MSVSETAITESAGKARDKSSDRLAVVLFNLGGPDSLEAVEPFLKNLFLDPAILPVPAPIRALLARRISSKRAPTTREIYTQLGGKTPLLGLTEEQAQALEKSLKSELDRAEIKVFVAMRYWHPRAKEVVGEVKAFEPDEVVLLPLYPQFSTTTSLSSINEWKEEATAQKLIVPTRSLCCYPVEENFVDAHVDLLADAISRVPKGQDFRLLFSAHGLPKQIIDGGDPYQSQVEQSVAAIVRRLEEAHGLKVDHAICYQSRVTKQEWIGPSTDNEVLRAAHEGLGIVLTPIAFVSEHSETLVELDVEYKELAEETGVPFYIRVPTLGTHEKFVRSLSGLVADLSRETRDFSVSPPKVNRLCDEGFGRCPCRTEGRGGDPVSGNDTKEITNG